MLQLAFIPGRRLVFRMDVLPCVQFGGVESWFYLGRNVP